MPSLLPPGLPPDVAQHAINFQQSLRHQQVPPGLPPDVAQHAINFRQQPAGQGARGGVVAVAVIVCLALGAIFVLKILVPLMIFSILVGR